MPDLSDETRRVADGYWSMRFGCTRDELRPPRALVFPHEAHTDHAGVYAMEFGAAPIISAAPELVPALRARTTELTRAGVRNPEPWVTAMTDPPDAVVGPAGVGYLDAPSAVDASARLLDPTDAALVAELRAACAADEWDESGIGRSAERPAVGTFAGAALAAVAGYEIWGGRI